MPAAPAPGPGPAGTARGRLGPDPLPGRLLAAFRVQVEVDGSHHMEVRHWEADMERQNDVWIGGDVILRFSAAGVRNRPDRVAAKLRRALVAAGWSEI